MVNPDQFYGKGFDALFPLGGSALTTGVPFPRARRLKDQSSYDRFAVAKTLSEPPQPVEFDPRTLKANQPSVTYPGVQHYMSGEYERTGRTYADQGQAGNRYPMVYTRPQDPDCHGADCAEEHVLLGGHHRATASLLKGEQLRALHTRGGWGPKRGDPTGHFGVMPTPDVEGAGKTRKEG